MSGIVGVAALDGKSVDRQLVKGLTAFLEFRGPHGQSTWCEGSVAFGHAKLRTTDEDSYQEEPLTIDGRVWIVADARIDDRSALRTKLQSLGQRIEEDVTDTELILRAYLAWGQALVDHLLGDFAFAVWDRPQNMLVCARDQLGVKPFFYAFTNELFIFSNTLDCVCEHPAVSSARDELAIADFLLFGANQEHDTTVYRDVRRLPAAHILVVARGQLKVRRYWECPIDEPVHFQDPVDYLRQFRFILDQAVTDRLRVSRVGILMSGGLDSPTLAATALDSMRRRSRGGSIHAFTSTYEHLVPDGDRHYAGLVAAHLGIPIHYDIRDNEKSICEWADIQIHTPEPVINPPAFAASVDFYRTASAHASVFLYGEGPDNTLQYEWQPYLLALIDKRDWNRLLTMALQFWSLHRRVPLLSTIPRIVKSKLRSDSLEFPTGLNADFVKRLNLRERWSKKQSRPAPVHPYRPRAYASLCSPVWQSLFEDCDLNGALSQTEVRHPFVDLRVLRYLLAVPAVPWCRHKMIIRASMKGVLPDAVRLRRKRPVTRSADLERVRRRGLPKQQASDELFDYVDRDASDKTVATRQALFSALRPLALDRWLTNTNNLQLRRERYERPAKVQPYR